MTGPMKDSSSSLNAQCVKHSINQLQSIAAGDEKAMREFFEENANSVYQYAISRCGDNSVANDVLNNVMMEVWKHADRFEGRSKISTWLISIARFKLIDLYRSEKKHLHNELEDCIEDPLAVSEQLAEAAQHTKSVKACVDRLGDVHKEIVHLTFYSDMAYPEIAQIINVPVGTVKSRMHHAKESLKRCLASFLGTENDHVII
ncbi:MAG: sigma-70 family RNA polymerase sigma factor [Kangiellaceae bacterium]|nr:sigma-70 family RNA polymerase sigma factor [Kangiellaceae bacterium]